MHACVCAHACFFFFLHKKNPFFPPVVQRGRGVGVGGRGGESPRNRNEFIDQDER